MPARIGSVLIVLLFSLPIFAEPVKILATVEVEKIDESCSAGPNPALNLPGIGDRGVMSVTFDSEDLFPGGDCGGGLYFSDYDPTPAFPFSEISVAQTAAGPIDMNDLIPFCMSEDGTGVYGHDGDGNGCGFGYESFSCSDEPCQHTSGSVVNYQVTNGPGAADPQNMVVIVDPSSSQLVGLDPTTGSQRFMRTLSRFDSPSGVVIDGQFMWVADRSAGKVFRLQTDGELLRVIDGFTNPRDIIVTTAGELIIADSGANSITYIDPFFASERTTYSGPGSGVWSVALDPTTQDVLVVDRFADSIYRGSTLIASGPPLNDMDSAVVDNFGNIYVTERSASAIYRIPSGSSTPELVSSGNMLVLPKSIAIGATGMLLVADPGAGAIVQVNPTNGQQSIFASGGLVSAPNDITFVTPVPEPATSLLLGFGAMLLRVFSSLRS